MAERTIRHTCPLQGIGPIASIARSSAGSRISFKHMRLAIGDSD